MPSCINRPPNSLAEPGMPIADVDTPALLLDLDAFEANIAAMAAWVGRSPVRLRPHAKAHKCPEVARRQMAAGAVGVCCQKVSEAEAMVAGGIPDVFIANEVVGARKIARVWTTVMSVAAARERVVVDAGLKAHSVDSGMPFVADRPDLRYTNASDEHGVIEGDGSHAMPGLGEKLRLIPGHCDPTVNLHDWLVCVRGGMVEALWPISARGAML